MLTHAMTWPYRQPCALTPTARIAAAFTLVALIAAGEFARLGASGLDIATMLTLFPSLTGITAAGASIVLVRDTNVPLAVWFDNRPRLRFADGISRTKGQAAWWRGLG